MQLEEAGVVSATDPKGQPREVPAICARRRLGDRRARADLVLTFELRQLIAQACSFVAILLCLEARADRDGTAKRT